MVLNGVGGRTVEEAQQRITYPEFLRWAAFRSKRGSLHLGMRVERGFALLASIYANTKCKSGFSIYDFMPHEDEPVLDFDAARRMWEGEDGD